MLFINLAGFLSLMACASACSPCRPNKRMGYLFINGSQPAFCRDLPTNELCPPNLVNYPTLSINGSTEQIINVELQYVKLTFDSLAFFQVSTECREVIREYSCSNTFAVCTTTETEYGVDVTYNFKKTEEACARSRSVCPVIVTEKVLYNCSLIQRDATGYADCSRLPEVPGDVCEMSSFSVGLLLWLFC